MNPLIKLKTGQWVDPSIVTALRVMEEIPSATGDGSTHPPRLGVDLQDRNCILIEYSSLEDAQAACSELAARINAARRGDTPVTEGSILVSPGNALRIKNEIHHALHWLRVFASDANTTEGAQATEALNNAESALALLAPDTKGGVECSDDQPEGNIIPWHVFYRITKHLEEFLSGWEDNGDVYLNEVLSALSLLNASTQKGAAS